MKNIAVNFILLCCLIFVSLVAKSEEKFDAYFVALKSKESNIRSGPNIRYPIKFKFTRKFEPLKVINKFENWRQVEDAEGDKGWIHISNLVVKKFAKTISKEKVNLYEKPSLDSRIEAHVGSNVLFTVINCKDAWCRLEKDGLKGWMEKKYLWGAIND